MVTLKQIAEEAGVSIMTVSNVIHKNSAKASPATVERVQAIIKKYNYVPNLAARSLSGRSSRIVALLLPRRNAPFDNLLLDPYNSMMTGMLEMKLHALGYYAMLCSFQTGDEVLTLQRNWQTDGCIMVYPHSDKEVRALIKNTASPLVIIDRYYQDMDSLSLVLDDEDGCYQSTLYCINKGHRKIGFGCPEVSISSVIQDRYAGYKRALREAGIKQDGRYFFNDYALLEGGRRLADRIAAMEDPPTALVTTQDLLASGVIAGMERLGKKIPGDLSVVGFDNVPIAQLCNPPLSTMEQNIDQKAEAAVSLLIEAIENPKLKNKKVTMGVTVLERESVAEL